MPQFYCPFCSTEYDLPNVRDNSPLLCSICGEDLEKKRLFKLSQIAALIVAFSFITPLTFAFFQILKGPKDVYQDTTKVTLNMLGQ